MGLGDYCFGGALFVLYGHIGSIWRLSGTNVSRRKEEEVIPPMRVRALMTYIVRIKYRWCG